MCAEKRASRSYTLKKRAEQQAETRRRIVEAAVELHGTLGPARTPLSLVAERAGVQRKTLYAHFPDQRSLFLACSGHSFEKSPPPDAEEWRAIADPAERLRAGLTSLYGWYDGNAELFACVLRDAEYHPPTREIAELRLGPLMTRYCEVLGQGLSPLQRAMLQLALAFPTWRTLVVQAGIKQSKAIDTLVEAVLRAD